jgi:hypothetical protein
MVRMVTNKSGEAPKPPVPQASARVSIFEVTLRPWGELVTDARRDGRVYVGSREWREMRRSARNRRLASL